MPEQKKYYYQDRLNGKVQWLKPADCDKEPPKDELGNQKPPPGFDSSKKKRPESPQDVPMEWDHYWDPKHEKYYFVSKRTGERTWFKPHVSETMTEARELLSRSLGGESIMRRMGSSVGTFDMSKGPLRKEEKGKKINDDARKFDVASVLWDHNVFVQRLDEAHRNHALQSAALKEVKPSNDDLIHYLHLHVPKTVAVSYEDCVNALIDKQVEGYHMDAQVTLSNRSTSDAINFFAADRWRVVCALNFASGTMPGGGYLEGSQSQEADLCRRIPLLYASLSHASETDELYKFGPSTMVSKDSPEKYSDVLFTPGIVHPKDRDGKGNDSDGLLMMRGSMKQGYPVLPENQRPRVSIVSAAPPNVHLNEEPDMALLANTICSIFVAPVLMEPRCTTLILGPWGCGQGGGHFGNDAAKIAGLFGQAITQQVPGFDICLGQLYHEIHFAVPSSPDDADLKTFRKVLQAQAVHVQEA